MNDRIYNVKKYLEISGYFIDLAQCDVQIYNEINEFFITLKNSFIEDKGVSKCFKIGNALGLSEEDMPEVLRSLYSRFSAFLSSERTEVFRILPELLEIVNSIKNGKLLGKKA